jgi:hypothetical protein
MMPTLDNKLITYFTSTLQTMAATKRNAGLTSALPRATLNDEELVSFTFPNLKQSILLFSLLIDVY